ncbi:hypothetical protein RIVM261_070170 [Rivularia sp. IAM M-261]|nr:hypothetical protein CAL7716_017980 [Calothrix sp. PCC 7716]GJD22061.1 hypothetical protein RIVM261_070170 [Rivularia sp. IAM M-261]
MDKHDYSKLVDLDGIFNQAVKETEEMLGHGFDLTEPCLVTPRLLVREQVSRNS